MFVDVVAPALAACVTGTGAGETGDGLLVGVGRGEVERVLFPHAPAGGAGEVAEFAAGFLSLVASAGILAVEGLPAVEEGDGTLAVPEIGDWEVGLAARFWDASGGQPVWMEARTGRTRRAWIASAGPERLRIFDATLAEGTGLLVVQPWGMDLAWDVGGAPKRSLHDPLGAAAACAEREAGAAGLAAPDAGTWATLTREVGLVVMVAAAMSFTGTRAYPADAGKGRPGRWRRVVRLGRDARLDAAREALGLAPWPPAAG